MRLANLLFCLSISLTIFSCKSAEVVNPYSFLKPPDPWLFDGGQSGKSWRSYNYINQKQGRRMLVVVNQCQTNLSCLQQFVHYRCRRFSKGLNVKTACLTREPSGLIAWHQRSIINVNSLSGTDLKTLEQDAQSLLTFLKDERDLEVGEKFFFLDEVKAINARITNFSGKDFLCAPLKANKLDTFCFHKTATEKIAKSYMGNRKRDGMTFSRESYGNKTYDLVTNENSAFVRDKSYLYSFHRKESKPIKPLIKSILRLRQSI